MAIDAFVSRPTKLPKAFEDAYDAFHCYVEKRHGLRLRRLGSTDYSDEAPLRAIIEIMNECKGAIILGYPQIEIFHHIRRSIDVSEDPTLMFPTPWNQIEASLAFGAKLPVLVIGHPGIGGGVFDHGVTGQYVLTEDLAQTDWFMQQPFQQLLAKWKKRIDPSAPTRKVPRTKVGRTKR